MGLLEKERLHKRIAASGLCSRRAAEKLITEGRVTVNGALVIELGSSVTQEDQVAVDGKPLGIARLHYIALNKPAGYVTTLADPHAKQTVKELLPDLGVLLKPVGRLDKDTEGLLLATNDGALALRLTHPRYGVEKEYQVAVDGQPDERSLRRLREGVYIEGGKTAPAQIEGVFFDEKKRQTFFRMVIKEGRKRQVRLMCMAVGHPVRKLRRVRFGPVHLSRLPRGTCRTLGKEEVDALKAAVGLLEVKAEDRPRRSPAFDKSKPDARPGARTARPPRRKQKA